MKTIIFILINYISICYPQVLNKSGNDSLNNIYGFYLYDTYKNPFGCINFIEFQIPIECDVSIIILQLDSNLQINYSNLDTIKILYDGYLDPGFYKMEWDFNDKEENPIENGFYLCYLNAAYFKNSYKMEFKAQTMIVLLR